VIASGGVVRIANSCTIEDGRLVKVRLSDDYLPQIQILEYIRAFILGRMAWTRLNGLMLISGAFGAFDKEIAIKAGGYNHKTVGEDMELVVRMRRYMEEKGEPYIVTYIPDPLCWTEAPASYKILGRQRNRWIRGTYETLKFHKIMFFNPRYHLLGMLSYPYWFFFELCAPVIEFIGFICFLIFAILGLMDWSFFFTFFLFIICFGYLYSAFAILMEVSTFHQYKRRVDILRLMLTGLTEPFVYHPFVVWSAIKGFWDLAKKKKGWGEMTRQGLSQAPKPAVTSQAVTPVTGLQAAPPEKEPAGRKLSVVEKTIVPLFARFFSFIGRSFSAFLGHALVLLCLMLAARVFELCLDYSRHGSPVLWGKVILYGFTKDIAVFLHFALPVYAGYALLSLIHRKLAAILFSIFGILYLFVQVALSQYFVTTLVPLGADLWGYTLADIRQTVGASGGINLTAVIIFVILFIITLAAFIFLPRKIRVIGWTGFFLFMLLLFTGSYTLLDKANRLHISDEYSNNLSMNKAWYFLDKSYQHFFPHTEEPDIYTEFNTQFEEQMSGTASTAAFKYLDGQQYPFLHSVDTGNDVLGPFFKKDSTPPNIVILLIEGLGRAFTNQGAYLGNFTPFIDSLSGHSLYWQNFLSEGGRTFAVLPSLLGSLPFGKNGFNELGINMPKHLSLLNILHNNGYDCAFYYGGDARFDNMNKYFEVNGIQKVNDEAGFPPGYQKMPVINGFTWGYGDKELFRRYMSGNNSQPRLDVVLTVSTHNPFFINEQDRYLQKFEERMQQLQMPEKIRQERRNYKYQFASILFMDDAVQSFIQAYKQRPDFKNTVFIITGDHRMPEIPMTTKIDRYHVPLLIYSPLLTRTARFASISTHFDITPSLLNWLHHYARIPIPAVASWMGAGLDTTRGFQNIHAYPLMQTKTEIADFVMGNYLLNNGSLFQIKPNMDLVSENDAEKSAQLNAAFQQFLDRNNRFIAKPVSIIPDSLLLKYAPR
jgi:phosphoglycerol transferase MdoB-like AlkP superfamily enzyme